MEEILYSSEKRIGLQLGHEVITDIKIMKSSEEQKYRGTITISGKTIGWVSNNKQSNEKSFNLMNSLDTLFDENPVPEGYVEKCALEMRSEIENHLAKAISVCFPELTIKYVMEHLFLVRHGDYRGDKLTDQGKQDISKLAEEIKSIAGESRLKILSSPKQEAMRAYESAKIIADSVGITEISEEKALFTRYQDVGSSELKCVEDVCNIQKGDGLILVSHGPIVPSFADRILETRFGPHEYISYVDKGKGLYINLHKGTNEIIPRKLK